MRMVRAPFNMVCGGWIALWRVALIWGLSALGGLALLLVLGGLLELRLLVIVAGSI